VRLVDRLRALTHEPGGLRDRGLVACGHVDLGNGEAVGP